jgi:methyl-accepting chemotaxis protein
LRVIEGISGTIREINTISTTVAAAVEQQRAAAAGDRPQRIAGGGRDTQFRRASGMCPQQQSRPAKRRASSDLTGQAQKLRGEMNAFLAQLRAA